MRATPYRRASSPEGEMFADEIRRVAETAPRARLPEISALLWKAYAADQVTEEDASELSTLIETRKALGAAQKPVQARVGSRPRTPAHLERRRRWAACGLLPPQLACRFTPGEVAALSVVAAEARKRGDCRLTMREIADVAGVGLSTVRNAIRAARTMRLVAVTERRLTGFRNLANIVRIACPSWQGWLRLGGAVKTVRRIPTGNNKEASQQRKPGRAAERQWAELAVRDEKRRRWRA